MKADLSSQVFDVLVVGEGITGALRGLSVARSDGRVFFVISWYEWTLVGWSKQAKEHGVSTSKIKQIEETVL